MGSNHGGMMGGGHGGDNNNNQGSFFEDDEQNVDPLAMLGVLASLKEGVGGAWDAYNNQLSATPVLVKVGTGGRRNRSLEVARATGVWKSHAHPRVSSKYLRWYQITG